jgi:cation diffusion facilitator CzcD-associated flavoprotein CzcO
MGGSYRNHAMWATRARATISSVCARARLTPARATRKIDLHEVQDKFSLNNIVYRTMVTSATFSRSDGLWHLEIKDLTTGETRRRTCNILLSCLGGLTIPNRPPFDPKSFDGPVFHSAEWPEDVDIKDKRVVVVGNGASTGSDRCGSAPAFLLTLGTERRRSEITGCSAAQIIPEIYKDAKSVTQVARSRQTFFKRIAVPDRPFLRFLMHYIPGVRLPPPFPFTFSCQ